jgi:CRP/FNR family transcriptional regulator, cyclic AMP receptor protein
MLDGQFDLLRGLAPSDAKAVLALGRRLTLESGEVLFGLGAQADRMFIIERGRIRLTLPMQVRGRQEDIMVEERGPGQTVGWSALTPPHRFTLRATALIETQVIAIPGDALRGWFGANPAAGYTVSLNLASVIGQRLQVFQAMWLREMQRVVEVHSA